MHSGLFVDLAGQNMYKQNQDGARNARRFLTLFREE